MEQILNKLGNSSEAKNIAGLVEALETAKDCLTKKQGTAPHVSRDKCLHCFAIALAAQSNKHKNISHLAVEGLQMILRDPILSADKNSSKESNSISVQMLKSLDPVSTWNSQIQCQVLMVIVQLISSNEFNITLTDVFAAIQICLTTYATTEEPGVKLGVRAALTQMLNSYCLNRQSKSDPSSQEELAVLMDATLLLNHILSKLNFTSSSAANAVNADELQLALDGLYSVISVQPLNFHRHLPLLNLLKLELIPALICLMQTCSEEKEKSPSAGRRLPLIVKQISLMTNSNSKATFKQGGCVFASAEVTRSFYQVVEQVFRLFTRTATVPVKGEDELRLLNELYRSSLLIPAPPNRLEALKLIKRMSTNSAKLADFLELIAAEPSFWLVMVECLEECSQGSSSAEIGVETVRSLQALINSLLSFVTDQECLQQAHFSKDFFVRLKSNCEDGEEARLNEEHWNAGNQDKIRISKENEKSAANQLEQSSNALPVSCFLHSLKNQLFEWLQTRDLDELNKKIERFSVYISKELCTVSADSPSQESQIPVTLSPDTIYLTTYAVLSYSLRSRAGANVDKAWLLSLVNGSEAFVNECWLVELYEYLCNTQNIFESAKVLETSLEKLIDNYDGLTDTPMPIKFKAVEKAWKKSSEIQLVEKWLKTQLASCWSSILIILTRFSPKIHEKKSISAEQKISLNGSEETLKCIQDLTALLLRFGMDKEVSWVYKRLAEEVCQLEDLRQMASQSIASSRKSLQVLLNKNDGMAIDLLVSNAIECGCLANGCWKYVVRCVEYIWELERYLFESIKQQTNYDTSSASSKSQGSLRDMLLNHSQNELSPTMTGKVLDELLLKIDSFFEEAPQRLNLPSLCTLLEALISANEYNLKYCDANSSPNLLASSCILLQRITKLVCAIASRHHIYLVKAWSCVKTHFIHISFAKFPEEVTRLSISCVYDCVKALIQPEYVDNGGSSSNFSFNQALFHTFQSILCSDVCKAETQEHIVTVLGSFIEEYQEQIGSGWKPLFGALKALRISNELNSCAVASTETEEHSPLRLPPVKLAVLDVFKKYLAIRSRSVLFSALPEYIHCLLHYLQSTSVQQECLPTNDQLENVVNESVFVFLSNTQNILFKTFEGAQNGVVNSSLLHRLKLRAEILDTVDECFISSQSLKTLPPLSSLLSESDHFGIFPSELDKRSPIMLETRPIPWTELPQTVQCICELLLSLVEGMAGLLLTCTQQMYSRLISGLAELVSSFHTFKIGADFGAFCLSTLLLPTLQKWVRRENVALKGFVATNQLPQSTRNLKQAMGTFTQSVVECLSQLPAGNPWSNRLLQDTLVLFNEEIVTHGSHFISGIGCSCLKHLLLSADFQPTQDHWTLVVWSVWRAVSLTLLPIRKLISQFFSDSTNFGGDLSNMKVLLREENEKAIQQDYSELQIMGKQVFLISEKQDSNSIKSKAYSSLANEGCSSRHSPFAYLFVLNDDTSTTKKAVPNTLAANLPPSSYIGLDEVIISLFNHQLLLQIIIHLLLGDSNSCNLLTNGSFSKSCNAQQPHNLSPILQSVQTELASKQAPHLLMALTLCLDASSKVAEQFDLRPALKFLLQKLCQWEESVNLYKVVVACHSTKLSAIFYQMDKEEKYSFYLEFLRNSLACLLDTLSGLENTATNNKAREWFSQPVQFSIVEDEETAEFARTEEPSKKPCRSYTIVPANQCLESFQKQKRTETMPPARANPFVAEVPKLVDHQNSALVPGFTDNSNNQLRLAQLQDIDIRILAYSEIVALFFEHLITQTNDAVFRQFTPQVFPLLRQFLDVTGNVRARRVISQYLKKMESLYLKHV